jgi:glutamate synthase domain-containing protein 2
VAAATGTIAGTLRDVTQAAARATADVPVVPGTVAGTGEAAASVVDGAGQAVAGLLAAR